jgi:peptide-O-fucosyltransferase
MLLWPLSASDVSAAPATRYLLFDVVPHEQLNKQRRALMFYLDLALRLDRTLVLPRARLLRHSPTAGASSSDAYEYARWGELFNVSALSKLHPVVELEDFLAEHGVVQRVYVIRSKDCQPRSSIEVHFNGIDGVRVSELLCDAKAQYVPHTLQALSLRSIAFSGSTDQLQLSRALVLRPSVRFVQSTYDAAAQFVERSFGGEPFVAVHWRRTDFLLVRRSQPGVLQSAEQVVKHVRRLQEATGIRHVYLATDSDDQSELDQIERALRPVRHPRTDAAASLLDRARLANVEIVICGLASRLLGTRTSSYTLAIAEERGAIFGHAPGTSEEMGSEPLPAQEVPSRDKSESPPPASPALAMARNDKFLFFDVAPHEQLNKQRRALMFYLDLAMRLERTLVLPRARLLRRVPPGSVSVRVDGAEYTAWGELFNVSHLRRLHPVIEWEAFLASSQPIDTLVELNPHGCVASRAAELKLNGVRRVSVAETICGAGMQNDLRSLDRMPQRVLAFSGATDQLPLARALTLRPNVRFVESTYQAASQFVERTFGGEPFVAVHWRRTDFLLVRRSQPGVLQSAQDVATHVRRVQEATGIRHVYVATDSDDETEMDELQRAVGAVWFISRDDALLRLQAARANIEIAICGMASRFLGTQTSSYTLAIIEERVAVFGHHSSTAEEMGLLSSAARVATGAGSSTPPAKRLKAEL